jgi:hypothetical protein
MKTAPGGACACDGMANISLDRLTDWYYLLARRFGEANYIGDTLFALKKYP